MPFGLVRECLEWMPRLRAEESLVEVRRIGVGTGSFAKGTGPQMVKQWEAIAHPTEGPAVTIETRQVQVKAAGVKVFGSSKQ